jgi:hypothetical protein
MHACIHIYIHTYKYICMAAREGAAETLRGVEEQLALATKGHASAIEVSRQHEAPHQ